MLASKKIFFWAVIGCLLITNTGQAGEQHSDSQLAELNDYLMALQVLRHSDAQADTLFQRWQDVREASWRVRYLTDEQELSADDPKVTQQIKKTRMLRRALLRNLRSFFHNQTEVLPTARIHLGERVEVSWDDSTVTVPVGSRHIILVEITSDRSNPSDLYLTSSHSDQILFWSKPVTVEKNYRRYTFVYVTPLEASLETNSIVAHDDRTGQTLSFTIHAKGTLPATYSWYNHRPGESIYTTEHGMSHPPPSLEKDESIRFRIRDPETGEPLPVRVEVRDTDDNTYWRPLNGSSYAVAQDDIGWDTPLWPLRQGGFFYAGADAELGVDPAGKTVRLYRGFEYAPVVTQVPEDGIVRTAPRRWIDMASQGWYSGQTHIHTTHSGLPVQHTQFWPLVAQAEDLGVSTILTLKGEWETHAIYADEYPMGTLASHSTPEHFIIYGEEYRNNPYGHLALVGLDHIIQPISSGALGELGAPDYPPNKVILDRAVSQGAITIGSHFGNYITSEKPISASWPSTGFEMPVDVALGKIHLAEIYGNGGQREVWYKLLNCGFTLPATAGPDWVIKDTPRVYVHLGEKPFTVDNWLEGLRQGRSFVTKGPMLFFTVEGSGPGNTITYSNRPRQVTVEASALTPNGPQPVEIVVNGEVVAQGTDISRSIRLDDSGWIAARTQGAHSNPVYVTLAGRPRGLAEDAHVFIDIINRLEKWVAKKGVFDNPAQKKTVLNVLHRGRAVYEDIVERAEQLDR